MTFGVSAVVLFAATCAMLVAADNCFTQNSQSQQSGESGSQFGYECTASQSCCGDHTPSATCIDKATEQCCISSNAQAFACPSSGACCGSPSFQPFCCPAASQCCGFDSSSGNATCCGAGTTCCGSSTANPTCCTATEVCSLDGICISNVTVPPPPPGPISPGTIVWDFVGSFPVSSAVYSSMYDALVFGSDSLHSVDKSTGKSKWVLPTTTGIASNPLLSGKAVVVATSNRLLAVDVRTGVILWSQPVVGAGMSFLSLGSRLFAYGNNMLKRVDSATGKTLWTQMDVVVQPTGTDAAIIVQGLAKLRALNPTTGAAIWTTENPNSCFTPILSSTIVIGCTADGNGGNAVVGFDLATGNNLWTIGAGFATPSTITVAGNIVAFFNQTQDGSGNMLVQTYNAATGMPAWSFNIGQASNAAFVATSSSYILVSNFGGVPSLLSLSVTGTSLWNSSNTYNFTSPIVLGSSGNLYAGINQPQTGILAVGGTTGTQLWFVNTTDLVVNAPLAVNGMVFVGCNDYHFYAIADRTIPH